MKIGRRHSLKLGAAAMVVGPSVVFSRPASAGDVDQKTVAKAFKVEVNGNFVPLVDAVDLGAVKFPPKGGRPSFNFVKIKFNPKARRSGIKFADITLKRGITNGVDKVSVLLYAEGGTKPAMTYELIGAKRWDPKGIKFDGRFLKWKPKDIKIMEHKDWSKTGRLRLPPTQKVKVVFPGGDPLPIQGVRRGRRGDFTKFDPKGYKIGETLELKSLVISGQEPLSVVLLGHKLGSVGHKVKPSAKFEGWPAKWDSRSTRANKASPKLILAARGGVADKSSPALYLGVKANKLERNTVKLTLTGIELPKLAKGDKVSVTETLQFKVEKLR